MTPRALRIALPWALLLLITGIAPAALAQPAHRVADVNTSADDGSAVFPWGNGVVTLGSIVFFAASDGVDGTELWRSDGTAAGTRRVKDVCPGSCPSGPLFLTVVGSEIFFSADDGAHGRELWQSDGTEAGTQLVRDVVPGLTGSGPGQLTEVNGRLFFAANDGVHGLEPWVSDGTEAGTVPLADIQPGAGASNPWLLGKVGASLLFSADDGVHGIELWKTDGTPAGTSFVKDINPGSGSALTFGSPFFLPKAVALGGQLLFAADDGTHGAELWTSDGTNAGTTLLADLAPGSDSSSPFNLVVAGALVYFQGRDSGHGVELWKSDGTAAGSTLVKDINPGAASSVPLELTAVGSQLFFSANDGVHGRELWKSDGTDAGTVLVKDVKPGAGEGVSFFPPAGLTALGSRLFLFADDGVHGSEPWTSDGTDAGTALLADLNPGSVGSFLGQGFGLNQVTTAAGRWYFGAFSPATGAEMYASDGTTAGTVLLADVNHQASAFNLAFFGSGLAAPGLLADLGGTLFFRATDGVSGQELWKSDGTAVGTAQVKDIEPGPGDSSPDDLTALGGELFFSTDNGTTAALWKSDGTTAGTQPLANLSTADLTPLGDTLLFSGEGSQGAEPWKTDGNIGGMAGTVLVKDIAPGTASSNPYGFTALGPALLFGATGPEGTELWRSDGTTAGTVLVKDVQPGAGSSVPLQLTAAGPLVFFSADDGTSGRELWAADGNVGGGAGTHRVKDVNPGSGSGVAESFDRENAFAVLGNTLFFAADDGVHGFELWKSDGTDAGTVLVKDVFPGARSAEIRWLTAAFDRIYFVADDGVHGRELWVSDGNVDGGTGTHLVADLLPGLGSSLPLELHAVGKRIVFSADDGVHGRELWKSNGTGAGTVLLEDLNPGPDSSSPLAFTESGGSLYFVANDGTTGFELWSLPREAVEGALDFYTVPPCRLLDTRSSTPMASGLVRTFALAGSCGVPATARAVAANLTVVQPGGQGFLKVYPHGGPVPMTSAVNVNPGRTRTNNALLTLAGGSADAFFSLTGGAEADLVLDVVGYFE
ncbi:MAG TPA: ELWxxDGT repeat protein [Thermoanaerobaculia bacterium]|nr:ELWxxDGT repeat protein [Thermoanaerobaculia bacterium]